MEWSPGSDPGPRVGPHPAAVSAGPRAAVSFLQSPIFWCRCDVCTWARVYRSSVRSLPSTFACTPGQQRGDPNPTRTERSWPLSASAPPHRRKSPGLHIHGPHPGNPLGQQVTGLQKVPEIIPVAPSHGEQEGSRADLSSLSRGDKRAIVSWTMSSPRVTQGEKTAQPPPRVLLGGGEPSSNQGPWGLEPPSLRRAGKAMPREGCKISLARWERSWRTVRTPYMGLRGSQRIRRRGWAGGWATPFAPFSHPLPAQRPTPVLAQDGGCREVSPPWCAWPTWLHIMFL